MWKGGRQKAGGGFVGADVDVDVDVDVDAGGGDGGVCGSRSSGSGGADAAAGPQGQNLRVHRSLTPPHPDVRYVMYLTKYCTYKDSTG
jgi:hypothetical protein